MKQRLLCFFMLGMLLIGSAYAQDRRISGRVTSATDGAPIAGVSVVAVGGSAATQTDDLGTFSINIPSSITQLEFRYLGYTPERVDVGTQSVLDVKLTEDAASLEEVVVTAMGIQRSAKSLTYATSRVDPEDILQNSEPDLLKSMQGKVAGVDIRTSQGTPGAATRFQVRGNSSFFGDNQPLIIVDGIPYDNSMVETSSMTSGGSGYSSGIANLDPNDIATFNVLKGSAAAALYGSRASNGAVIITTKSGSTQVDRPTEITL